MFSNLGRPRTACRLLIVLAILLFPIKCNNSNEMEKEEESIAVARWKFDEYSTIITVTLFLFAMVLIKIAYHKVPYVSEYVPESLVLIIIGIIFGAIVRYGIAKGSLDNTVWKLTPDLFFDYLLPPIVLESSYSLYNRTFSEYLGVVLLFAVLGTILNFLLIGFAMFGLFEAGAFGDKLLTFDIKGFLLFSSLIVAVDPVAVLAIFQDIGVELALYYIVFGESLLNDAITVVLYEIMIAFSGKDNVSGSEIGIGIASFFTVSFGGLLVGVVIGIIACLFTRIRSHLHVFTVIILAYFSYIMADTVAWSGIISMIGCGLVQAAYAFHNLDRDSVSLIHNLVKVAAEMSESVIFLFLGIEVVSTTLQWHTGFMLWALVLCLVARTVVVLGLTAIVNAVQVDNTKISFTQQAILIYGGLRGAVAFSLAVLIEPHKFQDKGEYNRQIIITATLFIILFTVGFMGMTMKPLVKLLKIKMEAEKKLSLFGSLNSSILDYTMAGLEIIAGSKGRNAVREFFMRIDEKYIRKILQNDPETYDQKMAKVYEKISNKLHEAALRPNQTEIFLDDIPEPLKHKYLTSHGSFPNVDEANETNLNLQRTQAYINAYKPNLDDPEAGGLEMKDIPTNDFEPDVGDIMRNANHAQLVPHQKRQLDFDSAFMDLFEARRRALQQTYGPRKSIGGGRLNPGFQADGESDPNGRKQGATGGGMQIKDNRKARRR